MSLFSLLSVSVLAAELIISPIPDNLPSPVTVFPAVSFAQLAGKKAIQPAVLGVATQSAQTASPAATPTRVTLASRKKHYTIAFLGDSMIDTLGPDLPHTQKELKKYYPGTTFTLLNFGAGGTNIAYGLERLTHSYTYLGKEIPSVVSQLPDIVVVESFGYNPFSYETGAIDAHWIKLAEIVTSIKANLPSSKIIIAVTIAPNSKTFGDGAAGLAFSSQDKQERTTVIKRYLESTIRFAASEHIPLADLYHSSLDSSNDGKLLYINGGDHIHYSEAGRSLFAEKVTNTILSNHMLE